MIKRKHRAVLIILVVFIISIAGMLYSYVKFSSVNVLRISYAAVSVYVGDKDYVVIKDGKHKVIMASAKESALSFNDYAEKENYIISEQMGAMHILEKDGESENVLVTYNKYYGLWRWE